MRSALQHTLIAMAIATLSVTAGCKSDTSYRERERTAGEEVEAKDEHGDTAIDDADEADEWKPPVGDG